VTVPLGARCGGGRGRPAMVLMSTMKIPTTRVDKATFKQIFRDYGEAFADLNPKHGSKLPNQLLLPPQSKRHLTRGCLAILGRLGIFKLKVAWPWGSR
jgi:hypothetical protein